MQTCLALIQEEDDSHLHSFDAEAFENRIQQTIDNHHLFTRENKILVACSGGKDSTVILYVLKKLGYTVEAITVDAHIGCYTEENLRNIRQMCQELDVRLHEIAFRKEFGRSMCYIQSVLKSKGYDYKNCHTCGVLRRYLLNKYSKEIKPDVLVTGHNLDDEAQVIIMNLLRGQLSLSARIGPRSGNSKHENSQFIPRVKPMYFTHEQDVVSYAKVKKFPVHYGECPCSSDSYRRDMKVIFNGFGEQREEVKENIVQQFIRLSPQLKKQYASLEKATPCEICDEPSSSAVCSACLILAKLKE